MHNIQDHCSSPPRVYVRTNSQTKVAWEGEAGSLWTNPQKNRDPNEVGVLETSPRSGALVYQLEDGTNGPSNCLA